MQVKYLVVHCSATRPDMDIGAEEIRKWHLQRGWSDIGYHFVIRRDGSTEPGRDTNRPGAHVKGYNNESLGICLVGGIDNDGRAENNFTQLQMMSLLEILGALNAEYPDAEILGHRDFPGVTKECPSFDVRDYLNSTLDE